LVSRDEEVARCNAKIAAEQEMRARQHESVETFRHKLGPAFPAVEAWAGNPEARELSSPWADRTWNESRTRVFVEALRLHRAFIECVPARIRKNLHGVIDILSGKVSASLGGEEAFRSAWATLFFLIPVVSTTFASFDRLFSHCGRESLGWLLIDEAGQATPQSAAGALWRSKRAVIVGDPLQLEPIVPLPFTAQQALRTHFGVDETWLPAGNSVQSLADRVSRFGTWLESEQAERRIWVGSPLRVHRRCEKPMFNISNEIAYSGQMVYATEEARLWLPPSSWIDVASLESDDHWIPAEGLVLKGLLADLYRSGVRPSNVLLISPFRAVARKLREIAVRHSIPHAGTIHVSQGKESDIVILVLGGDARRPGAKEWASEKPNLLNVAVSRAKRRIYIIGNRAEWGEYPNFSDAAALLGQQEATSAQGSGRTR
jgi:superfamily I DNA and/or RNA helicase